MKIRNGFVSNSSSASFVLANNNISESDFEAIKSVIRSYMSQDDFKRYGYSDSWHIYMEDDTIKGDTVMNNECLEEFLKENMSDALYGAFWKNVDWRD